jgi:hypothetical protein
MLNKAKAIALVTALGATALLGACASTQKEELPQVDKEGLQLVEGSKAAAAYKDPNADFSQFKRVSIAEVEVAFRKNWLRDQNQERMSASRRVSQDDANKIKTAVAEEFTRIFTEELQKGGYDVVDYEGFENSADDLLLLVPAIVNLDVTAPDTMSAGRSRSFTASAGSMTLYLEFHDSVSGALLGRIMDAQSAPDRGYMSVSNSVTNKADADRMLRKWAKLLVAGLDKVHGKS